MFMKPLVHPKRKRAARAGRPATGAGALRRQGAVLNRSVSVDYKTIAPGQVADFVVLDANPLEDIANTRRISAVYLRGAAVDREMIAERETD
jgi:cytosine/adenosine deaminase-related metal-dependent hydrolase